MGRQVGEQPVAAGAGGRLGADWGGVVVVVVVLLLLRFSGLPRASVLLSFSVSFPFSVSFFSFPRCQRHYRVSIPIRLSARDPR